MRGGRRHVLTVTSSIHTITNTASGSGRYWCGEDQSLPGGITRGEGDESHYPAGLRIYRRHGLDLKRSLSHGPGSRRRVTGYGVGGTEHPAQAELLISYLQSSIIHGHDTHKRAPTG